MKKKVKEHIRIDIFGIEFIPQKVLNKGKRITHIIFSIQSDDSIMYGFYFIAFIEYKIAGKTLLDYSNLLFPNDYKKNGKIIYKYFKDNDGER